MQIIKKVLIKQIVTEKSKELLKQKFKQEIMRLEQECQQLLFEQRKLQNKRGGEKQDIAERIQQELKTRKEKIVMVDFKLEQLEILEIGSEIVEDEVEALVEVKEGTHWNKVINEQAIIIKDNKIIRIDR